uniref:Uncharacterized protein n=1 Tax=Oryza rufipogon TaxID=4529 RepID=A0A0E0RFV8_ORYRU
MRGRGPVARPTRGARSRGGKRASSLALEQSNGWSLHCGERASDSPSPRALPLRVADLIVVLGSASRCRLRNLIAGRKWRQSEEDDDHEQLRLLVVGRERRSPDPLCHHLQNRATAAVLPPALLQGRYRHCSARRTLLLPPHGMEDAVARPGGEESRRRLREEGSRSRRREQGRASMEQRAYYFVIISETCQDEQLDDSNVETFRRLLPSSDALGAKSKPELTLPSTDWSAWRTEAMAAAASRDPHDTRKASLTWPPSVVTSEPTTSSPSLSRALHCRSVSMDEEAATLLCDGEERVSERR